MLIRRRAVLLAFGVATRKPTERIVRRHDFGLPWVPPVAGGKLACDGGHCFESWRRTKGWHSDKIYRGFGCGGGFGTPVVSYAPRPWLANTGVSLVTILTSGRRAARFKVLCRSQY